MLQLALVKLVEIIGEAAKAVSDETRRRYPDVPWSLAGRTRDRLIHHYFEVDLEVFWSTVSDSLPALLAGLHIAP